MSGSAARRLPTLPAATPAVMAVPLDKCATHSGRCVPAAVKRLLRGFLCGAGGQALLAAVMGAFKRRRPMPQVVTPDTLRFGAFVGLMCASNSAVRCALKHLRGGDFRSNAAVAGAVAGLALFVDKPSRHASVSLYILCRAVYAGVHALMRTGTIPRIPYIATGLFSISQIFIMYAGLFEPNLLDPGYYKFMQNVGNLSHSGLEWTFR